ncbi:RelA/SpoT domain-containing protein [Tistrella sp. BH-R2-4]|uniref:RelA/SpoT domain-containing protein n=1 Tax=Tistrella arctica TaxID=3133430 RepID=A0ABU9YJJ7_9PROT
MTKFVEPPTSKRAVNRSGEKIAFGSANPDDIAIVDQWRASHAYVLNTFQIFFKRRVADHDQNIEFAQRLKRRNTIIDKLQRRNEAGQRLMGDVTSMQDFAGCRLIFPDMKTLISFREFVHSTEKMRSVFHVLKHADDPEKYNYFKTPKWTGYRGIHEIFVHRPRPHRKGEDVAKPWRNLLCEIQYRTRIQHAWATALEISDFLDGERTKFALQEENPSPRVRFFRLVSELLARYHEGADHALVDLSLDEIRDEIRTLDASLGIMGRLRAMRAFENFSQLKRHNVLNIIKGPDGEPKLEIFPFNNSVNAIAKSQELESSADSLNAVYVASDRPGELRKAYKNYFNDPVDFVELVTQALNEPILPNIAAR